MAPRNGTLRAVIIDHYDSYTNNILQLLPEPQWNAAVIRFDQFSWPEFRDEIVPHLDAIILSPGPGRPDRESDFGFNTQLIREANIPILGICLGHQGIGTSFGARIVHAPNIKHGQISKIHHTNAGVLRALPQGFDAVRYNSLVLAIDDLPPQLDVTAWAYDPEEPSRRVLMGVQHRHRPIFGVQWHPESICSALGQDILGNFRDIVMDFWSVSTPWNGWSGRFLQPNTSLPSHVVKAGSIVEEARTGVIPVPAATEATLSLPYFIKSVTLGTGFQPHQVFERFIHHTSPDGEAWLDSARVRDSHSRNSYLASATLGLSYSSESRALSVYRGGERVHRKRLDKSYWTWLDDFQRTVLQGNTDAIPADGLGVEAADGHPLFQVGLIGYFGYELKRESLPGYTFTPSLEEADNRHTDSLFLFANKVFWLDNYTQTWRVLGFVRRGTEDPVATALGTTTVALTEAEFDAYVEEVRHGLTQPLPQVEPIPLPEFTAIDNEQTYSASIQAARHSIKEGESYELTLTTKFRASGPEGDAYPLYLSLRARNPAPYSAYLNFPTLDVAILSSSPERFISVDRNGVAEMKPIKGTVAVSPDAKENQQRIQTLQTDTKELAENLMIVDLIRADLHNVSPSITIEVPKLLKVESYETVHQLVTTIRSRIAPGVGPVKVLERTFPPGSMTGAPKLRSVQILDVLEHHTDRGVYSGSLGYLCASGSVDQSVVIRTIVKNGKSYELGAGGAITWLSEPDREWEEVMVKANAVAKSKPFSVHASEDAAFPVLPSIPNLHDGFREEIQGLDSRIPVFASH